MPSIFSLRSGRVALQVGTVLVLCGAGGAWAQQPAGATAKQLTGHWTLVTVANEVDGKKDEPFGPSPRGLFIFDASGRYSIQIFRPDLPKFAANNRMKGTPEENQAVVQGMLSHFGTYKVDDRQGTFAIRPEAASFPNWSGVEQPARRFEIAGDNLKIINPAPSGDSGTSYLILKRAR